jgi:hypothetical protein
MIKIKIDPSGFIGNTIIIALFTGVFLLKYTFSQDHFLNRFRPVDFIMFALTLIFARGFFQSGWIKFYLRYRLIIFSLLVILILAIIDLIFRGQWKEIVIDVYSLLYLLLPLYLFVILKYKINFKLISYLSVFFILVTVFLITQSIIRFETIDRMLLLGTFLDPNHTSSWIIGATLLVIAFMGKDFNKFHYFFIISMLILSGLTDSNASNLSIFVIVAYFLISNSKSSSYSIYSKVSYLFVTVLVLFATLFVSPKVISNIVTTNQLSSQNYNLFLSDASPKTNTDASPKTNTDASPKTISLIETIKNFNFKIIEPRRLGQVTESRKTLFSQALLKFKDNPLGVGFDETLVKVPTSGAMMGIHNIFLTFLVAHGVVGLLALIFLFYSLYRYGGLYSRAYLLSIATVGFFQESFSWRHQWLFLALFYIIDENYKTKSEKSTTLVQQFES